MKIAAEITRCAALDDDTLWASVKALAKGERKELARFLIHLAEVAKRELHVRRAYAGLYPYLRSLGFSEWDSRARALACVAAMKYRSIYALVGSGRLTLSALALIAPFLKPANH